MKKVLQKVLKCTSVSKKDVGEQLVNVNIYLGPMLKNVLV